MSQRQEERLRSAQLKAAEAILRAEGDCDNAAGYAGGVVPCKDCPLSQLKTVHTEYENVYETYMSCPFGQYIRASAKVVEALEQWCAANAPEILINVKL